MTSKYGMTEAICAFPRGDRGSKSEGLFYLRTRTGALGSAKPRTNLERSKHEQAEREQVGGGTFCAVQLQVIF